MITKEQATRLRTGAVLEHTRPEDGYRNADRTPIRVRVNGQCKTWKTRPKEWRLPVKYGLSTCFHITNLNATDWRIWGE